MYFLLKNFLFLLNPEQSHTVALQSLNAAYQSGLLKLQRSIPDNPQHLMGVTFPNPIGLAAGLDKNADYVDALAALGFGFIEVGTVTPKPQTGNPKPRLFRLTKEEAIINRMGFNNKGVEHVAEQLAKTKYRGILGINIGKNKDTTNENAIDDYLLCFRHLGKYASYITINISSPNTPGLRELQKSELLTALLKRLKEEQNMFSQTLKYIPLVVKISPDLSDLELETVADVLLAQKIDGVIATNTTISRDGVTTSPFANEAGGLSGRPLESRSTATLKKLHELVQGKIPIIASGGIMDKKSAQAKLQAGARLLQIYTGFIYRGPKLIRELAAL